MRNSKLKVGDRVEILPSATSVGVESEDIGKAGTIKSIDRGADIRWGLLVDMDEVCIKRGYTPLWSVGFGMVKLLPKRGEQLMFSFMGQEDV